MGFYDAVLAVAVGLAVYDLIKLLVVTFVTVIVAIAK